MGYTLILSDGMNRLQKLLNKIYQKIKVCQLDQKSFCIYIFFRTFNTSVLLIASKCIIESAWGKTARMLRFNGTDASLYEHHMYKVELALALFVELLNYVPSNFISPKSLVDLFFECM